MLPHLILLALCGPLCSILLALCTIALDFINLLVYHYVRPYRPFALSHLIMLTHYVSSYSIMSSNCDVRTCEVRHSIACSANNRCHQIVLPNKFPLHSPSREVGGMCYSKNDVANLLVPRINVFALFFDTLTPCNICINSSCMTNKIHISN